jgi:hypothetical protein
MSVSVTVSNVNPPKVSALRALSELIVQCASIEARIDRMEEIVEKRKLSDFEETSLILVSETVETIEETTIIVATGQH